MIIRLDGPVNQANLKRICHASSPPLTPSLHGGRQSVRRRTSLGRIGRAQIKCHSSNGRGSTKAKRSEKSAMQRSTRSGRAPVRNDMRRHPVTHSLLVEICTEERACQSLHFLPHRRASDFSFHVSFSQAAARRKCMGEATAKSRIAPAEEQAFFSASTEAARTQHFRVPLVYFVCLCTRVTVLPENGPHGHPAPSSETTKRAHARACLPGRP